ncbi:MAG: class I SAM-dependent methyltransferase [Candidatus Eremiobacteraeota bacterium]|nr:class I SAM-dependent methyltransferase [Candidatus Eremiobacteraeota bacterium]
MRTSEFHQSNRQAWNEGAARYREWIDDDIVFLRAGGIGLEPPELRYLVDLKSWCKRAIHLQCAGGKDTLSLWNHGAHEVIGVDISEVMIDCARQKSEALNAPARWIHSDILLTPHDLDGTADLVYTGKGAICWIMDIEAWADVVARLLVPGGMLYLFEGHPILDCMDLEASEFRLDSVYGNYFSQEAFESKGWSSEYIGELEKPASEQTPKYEKIWPVGRAVTTLISTGLRIEALEEHPEPFWGGMSKMDLEYKKRLPNTYSVVARKPL